MDRETFLKVKALKEVTEKKKAKNSVSELPLFKLVYCATCGDEMRRTIGADNRPKLACNFGRFDKKCSKGYTDYEDVEDAIIDAIKEK